MQTANISKKPGFFYGYWIIVTTFIMLSLNYGLGYYSFSLFVKPLEDEFEWTRGGIMMALTVYYLVQSTVSPFIGRVVDRYGARILIAIGAIVAGLGLLMLSYTESIWYFYIGYAVFSLFFKSYCGFGSKGSDNRLPVEV